MPSAAAMVTTCIIVATTLDVELFLLLDSLSSNNLNQRELTMFTQGQNQSEHYQSSIMDTFKVIISQQTALVDRIIT